MSDHPSQQAETDQAAANREFAAAPLSPWSGNKRIVRFPRMLFGSALFRFSSHTRHPSRRAIPRLLGDTIGQRTFDEPQRHGLPRNIP